MAPMALEDTHPIKRTSTDAEFDIPFAKKQNRGSLRHHKSAWDLQRSSRLAAPGPDGEKPQSLLTRSLALALEVVGFEGAEPMAMESFQAAVEEYISQFVADVRFSMASCRRVQPIPQDFLHALCTKNISLHSLVPQLRASVPAAKSQFALEKEPIAKDEAVDAVVLRRILNDGPTGQSISHIPSNFPAYPSQHTYKSTPVFSKREEDPRKIRELAMEEGRLAEESIRRLLGATSGQMSADLKSDGCAKKSLRAMRDEIWKDTMLAVGTDTAPSMDYNAQDPERRENEQAPGANALERVHLSSAVNSDKRYWRKTATIRTRTAAAASPLESFQHRGFT